MRNAVEALTDKRFGSRHHTTYSAGYGITNGGCFGANIFDGIGKASAEQVGVELENKY